jgi:hypothetical protein
MLGQGWAVSDLPAVVKAGQDLASRRRCGVPVCAGGATIVARMKKETLEAAAILP